MKQCGPTAGGIACRENTYLSATFAGKDVIIFEGTVEVFIDDGSHCLWMQKGPRGRVQGVEGIEAWGLAVWWEGKAVRGVCELGELARRRARVDSV